MRMPMRGRRYVAERLVASTTKATSTQGDEVIAEIFKTTGGAGSGAALKDPLGRGYIDPLTMTLVRRETRAWRVGGGGGGARVPAADGRASR